MKILFLIARYPGYGGIENVTTKLANYFANECGHNVWIVSNSQQEETQLIKELSTKVEFVKMPDTFAKSDINRAFFMDLLNEKQIELIIYQDSYFPNENLLDVARNCINHIKLICVEHSAPDNVLRTFDTAIANVQWWNMFELAKLYFFKTKVLKSNKRRKRWLYAICDKYMVLSKQYEKIFVELNEINDTSKLTSLGNPVSFKVANLNLLKKEKICLFVGRLSPEKGLDKLMQIWKQFEYKHLDWKLVIVGDGPKRHIIEDAIIDYGLKKVQIEGFKTNVQDYYTKASIFLMTSNFEGFPLSLPEAICCGCVPIALNTFLSVNDIISNGTDGFVIDNLSDYLMVLEKLVESPKMLDTMAKSCIDKARLFSEDNWYRQWNSIINSI